MTITVFSNLDLLMCVALKSCLVVNFLAAGCYLGRRFVNTGGQTCLPRVHA